LNSNGKRNSNLLSPKDKGNKIYWSKKDVIGILVINIIIKKIKINKKEPTKPKIIFFQLKLKTK
tara:strand:- start:34 stop:225 length:192 start_codon:yes stop_codon:yes gene_type:complete